MSEGQVNNLVKPIRAHTRFERARIIGARALQIGMGAPIFVDEKTLRDEFREELVSIYGIDEANIRFVLDPLKIAMYEYEKELIPIDIDPHED
jgi:DNA-directed RNA polymerase subunit K/omega